MVNEGGMAMIKPVSKCKCGVLFDWKTGEIEGLTCGEPCRFVMGKAGLMATAPD